MLSKQEWLSNILRLAVRLCLVLVTRTLSTLLRDVLAVQYLVASPIVECFGGRYEGDKALQRTGLSKTMPNTMELVRGGRILLHSGTDESVSLIEAKVIIEKQGVIASSLRRK